MDGRTRRRRPHRPRRPERAADRRRPRLAADARPAAASSRPTPPSRAAWRCTPTAPARTSRSGSTARYVPAGYGWSFPARDGAAHRRRLLRPALPRQGHHGEAGRGPRRRTPCATRATGSRTSSAPPPRTASSSPATPPATACRSPPRASAPRSTSASPAGASCARWSRAAPAPRAGAARATALLGRARVEVPLDAARAEARAAHLRRGCCSGVIARDEAPRARGLGLRRTTCGSRRPSSRRGAAAARRARRARAGRAPSSRRAVARVAG